MSKKYFIISFSILGLASCSIQDMTPPEIVIPEQSTEVIEMLSKYNESIAAYQYVAEGKANVIEMSEDGNIILDNGSELYTTTNSEPDKDIPLLGIDADGYWIYSLNGETQNLKTASGDEIPALSSVGGGVFTPQLGITEDGYWQFTVNGYQWLKLSDVMIPSLNEKDMSSFSFFKSSSLNNGVLSLASIVGETLVSLQMPEDNTAEAWRRYLMKTDDNVLLDFSYAGYMHGEVAPPDVNSLGYTTVNIKEYMQENNMTDCRLALNSILYDYKLVRTCPGKTNNSNTNPNAKLIVYFPEGEYVLQNGTETEPFPEIYGGNFVIKGAGAELTKIKMTGLNDNLKKPLLAIKNTKSPTNVDHSPLLATVNANAKKGDFMVKVDQTLGITPGTWVQLRLRSGNKDLVKSELGGITPGTNPEWAINKQPTVAQSGGEDENGVRIYEFHQVKSVGNGTIVFEDPIMHDIDIAYDDCGGWQIRTYNYFENVGIEDLTFEGNCVTPYYHHGPNGDNSGANDWQYDEGYVPVQLSRVVNSWVRNVNFVSVSEAVTFGESANCSAYNIQISGNRGHSAVRSQLSSRIFIGKVTDNSSDSRGHGQWHGCGVSKPSIGTVVWNCTWGKDACFESHATQPRATLFDKCSGGLVKYHAGGAEEQNPNHLADLTIWNLNVTGTIDEEGRNFATDFNWWSNTDKWWKVYPPVVVGTNGKKVTFADTDTQMTYCEGVGTVVVPESLYEAQLKKRLGSVPAWLNSLK